MSAPEINQLATSLLEPIHLVGAEDRALFLAVLVPIGKSSKVYLISLLNFPSITST